jgi:hypothetical protein
MGNWNIGATPVQLPWLKGPAERSGLCWVQTVVANLGRAICPSMVQRQESISKAALHVMHFMQVRQ